MSERTGYIEVVEANGVIFSDTQYEDMVVYTETSNQNILLGTLKSNLSAIAIRNRSIAMNANVGINTSNPQVALDIRAKDAVQLPVGNTTERPQIPNTGQIRYNTQIRAFEGYGASALWESMGGTSIKDTNQDTYISTETWPTSNDDTIRFFNATKETVTILQNGKFGINTSNPQSQLHVNGDLLVSSNAVFQSNVQITSNLFAMENVGIGTTTPQFKLDVQGNARVSQGLEVGGDLTVLGSVTSVQSTTVNINDAMITLNNAAPYYPLLQAGLEINRGVMNDKYYIIFDELSGYFKVGTQASLQSVATRDDVVIPDSLAIWNDTSKKYTSLPDLVYTQNRLGVGTSAPSETLDIIGSIKASNDIYALSKISIGHSNPLAQLDVSGTALFSQRVGIATQTPEESLHVVGNTKVSGTMAIVNNFNLGIGTSNPSEALHINTGNARIGSNIYVDNMCSVGYSSFTGLRERMEVQGNIRASSNIYVTNRLGIATSNPSVSLEINAQDAMLIPRGASSARPPAPQQGHMRYNSDLNTFEGYGAGNAWGSLGGVKDTNQDTFISAESFPTSNDDNITFVNSNIERMRLTRTGALGLNTSNPSCTLDVNTTDAIAVPAGTTNERPVSVKAGHVRYNTTLNTFEGYGAGNAWGSLGGVKDTNQDTFISAESFPTSNDDNITFVNSNIERMRLTREGALGLNTSNPTCSLDINAKDAIAIPAGTTAERPVSIKPGHVRYNTTINTFEGYGAGNAWGSLGGVKDTNQDTFISAESFPTSNDDNITFVNSNIERMRLTREGALGINTTTPTCSLDINTKDAIAVPVGTTAERPASTKTGHIRYNTTLTTFEGYGAGNSWGSLGGVKDTNQDTFVSAEEVAGVNDDTLRFVNSNTETMRVTPQGLVGINTQTPLERFHVANGNARIDENIYVSTRALIGGGANSNPSEALDVIGNIKASSGLYSMSNTGIGLSNPSVALEVAGDIKARSNVEVLGNLTVRGTTTVVDSTNVTIADNIIRVNNGATYTSSLLAGIEINRGGELYEDYQLVFSETNQEFMAGPTSSLKPVALRKASPETGTIPYFDTSSQSYNSTTSLVYIGDRLGVGTSNPRASLDIDSTDAILIPVGTTPQRPAVANQGMIRYNSSINTFEGYGAGNAWGSLGGVKDTNQDTYISAESFPTSNDDTLRFFNNGVETMTLTPEGYLGVGTTTPEYHLDVNGSLNATGLLINGSPLSTNVGGGFATSNGGYSVTTCNVVIGNIEPTSEHALTIQGTSYITQGLLIESSDSARYATMNKDIFTSGSRSNQGGRWGMFQNSNSLLLATAYSNTNSITFGSFNADSTIARTAVTINTSNTRVGFGGKQNPAYSVDVSGDVNVSGRFLKNGFEIIGNANGGGGIVSSFQPVPAMQTYAIMSQGAQQSVFELEVDGNLLADPKNVQVMMNGTKLAYINESNKDFSLLVTNPTPYTTKFTITLISPAIYGDVIDITVWPYIPDVSGVFLTSVDFASNITFSNIGIGISNPVYPLHSVKPDGTGNWLAGFENGPVQTLVSHSSGKAMRLSCSTSNSIDDPLFECVNTSYSNAMLYVRNDGVVGIGTSNLSSGFMLQVHGAINASGSVTSSSDKRVKSDIQPIINPLETLKTMTGYTFLHRSHPSKRQMGLLAQEVEAVAPEVVFESDDGLKNVAYGNLVALLLEAIKEQQKEIENLKYHIFGL